jgi:hypothetical protein
MAAWVVRAETKEREGQALGMEEQAPLALEGAQGVWFAALPRRCSGARMETSDRTVVLAGTQKMIPAMAVVEETRALPRQARLSVLKPGSLGGTISMRWRLDLMRTTTLQWEALDLTDTTVAVAVAVDLVGQAVGVEVHTPSVE